MTHALSLKALAADFDVSYADVVVIASIAGRGGFLQLPIEKRQQIAAASRRIWARLGDSASYVLYQRIKDVVTMPKPMRRAA